MAITVTITCATDRRPGSYTLTCTQCSDGNHLGHFTDPVAADAAARAHRCVFPQVSVGERRQGMMVEQAFTVLHKGSLLFLTHGEATALLANLAATMAAANREQHDKGTRTTLDVLNVDVAACRLPQVTP